MVDVHQARPDQALDDKHAVVDLVVLVLGERVVVRGVAQHADLPGRARVVAVLAERFEAQLVGVLGL